MDIIERELKKRDIEKLYLMGFKQQEIAKVVNLARQTVHVLLHEINAQRLKEHSNNYPITNEILQNYKRLLEEAWLNYNQSPNKEAALGKIREILSDRADKLAKLGIIKSQPDKIDITSNGKEIEETEIFIMLDKLSKKDGKN
jgi:transposase